VGGVLEFEFTVAAPGLAGDYNNDNSVDAADYVMFRKLEGLTFMLPNDPTGVPTVGTAHYNQWTENFGNMSPGAGGVASAAEDDETPVRVASIFTLAVR
jgi:hypothetical protein